MHRAFEKSLGIQLIAIILLVFMLPTLLLSVFTGTVLFRSIQEKTEASLSTSASHAAQLAINNVEQLITLAKEVTYDGVLAVATSNYASGFTPRYEDYYMEVRAYLDPKFGRESTVRFAAFYPLSNANDLIIGRLGKTANPTEQADLYLQTAHQEVLTLCETLDTRTAFLTNGGYTYLVRNLLNMRLQRFGVLVLGIDMNELLVNILSESDKWQASLDVQLSGYASDSSIDLSTLPIGISDEGNCVLLTGKVKGKDSTMYYRLQLDKNTLYKEVRDFQMLLAALIMFFIPVLTLSIVFIRRRLLKPIKLLANAASRIEKGELGITVPMRGKDELGQLGVSFSKMSLQLKDLIETSYLKEIALRDAKIDALQSRINPHFMNNALELINWQARMEGADSVSEMIDALSLLMNAAMDRDNERLVMLSHEMAVADAYFFFIDLRYGKRLTIEKNIDHTLSNVLVPRLVIQTLLENAVEHGIASAGGGHIGLSIFSQENQLVIEVINNGQKLAMADLKRISDILNGNSDSNGRLGLASTSHRLRLIFDGKASVRVSQSLFGETVFTVVMPLS